MTQFVEWIALLHWKKYCIWQSIIRLTWSYLGGTYFTITSLAGRRFILLWTSLDDIRWGLIRFRFKSYPAPKRRLFVLDNGIWLTMKTSITPWIFQFLPFMGTMTILPERGVRRESCYLRWIFLMLPTWSTTLDDKTK